MRGTALLTDGNDGPGHSTSTSPPNPDHPQPAVLHAALEPRAEPEPLQLQDRARGQAVAAGLVAGELRGVDDQHVATGATRPRGRRRAGGSGPDDDHVGPRIHAPSMLAG